MGGMIAAEMAAVQPNDVTRLALIAPAGLWDDDHPIADLFATLPYEMPALLFHDAEAGAAMLTAGATSPTRTSCRPTWSPTRGSWAWPGASCSRSRNGAGGPLHRIRRGR
jgi:pimeloyl-ACP methyl ester carboxylesterase